MYADSQESIYGVGKQRMLLSKCAGVNVGLNIFWCHLTLIPFLNDAAKMVSRMTLIPFKFQTGLSYVACAHD